MLRLTLIGMATVAALGTARGLTRVRDRGTVMSSPGSALALVPGRCDTSNNGWAAALRDYVVPIVTASGRGADRLRAASQLPAALASDVSIVTNDSVCAAAYTAHVALRYSGDTMRVRSIALVRAGPTRYVLEDGLTRAGEWELLDVYDSSFRYLASFTR